MFKYAVQTPKSDFCFVVSDVRRKFGIRPQTGGVARGFVWLATCFLLSFVLIIMLVTSLTWTWGTGGINRFVRSQVGGWLCDVTSACLVECFFFFSYVWILLGDHFGYYAMRRNRTRVGFLIPREGKFKWTKTHLCYGVESGELYCCRELPAAPSIASIQL